MSLFWKVPFIDSFLSFIFPIRHDDDSAFMTVIRTDGVITGKCGFT
ncbi:MAG: hypothetical protein HGB09_07295 [Chlorobiaceae bacterium]|nr:hypothetical protein [Chlorobiaceae bacterium]